MDDKLSRGEILKQLVVLPALAAVLAGGAGAPALAAGSKSQFHYVDHPGKNGQKCAGCRFFKAPNACSIVSGKISPNGWCIAWSKK